MISSDSISAELASLCELHDVVYYETGSRLDSAFDEDELTDPVDPSQLTIDDTLQNDDGESEKSQEVQKWQLVINVEPYRLECRARVLVKFKAARYLVDAGAIFVSETVIDEFPREVVFTFIEDVAMPNLLPYIRTEMQQNAAKIGADRHVFRQLTSLGLHEALMQAPVEDETTE